MTEHLWDTEPIEHVTYTPPSFFDKPWIIRMCCGCDTLNCKALLIDKGNGLEEYIFRQEIAQGINDFPRKEKN
jgi:hypothetical protein